MPYFIEFQFDALVVDKMGNAALGGMPFLIANRIITDAAAGTLKYNAIMARTNTVLTRLINTSTH